MQDLAMIILLFYRNQLDLYLEVCNLRHRAMNTVIRSLVGIDIGSRYRGIA